MKKRTRNLTAHQPNNGIIQSFNYFHSYFRIVKTVEKSKEVIVEAISNLPNKPLIEAIFELRWELKQPIPGPFVEPEYHLLFARLYAALQDTFPDYVPLEIAKAGVHFPWVVEHQFKAKEGWPIVQLGPGILTVNETQAYTWESFEQQVRYVVETVFEIWGTSSPLIKTISLHYIDAIEVDYTRVDPLGFLRDKLKVSIELPASLFQKHSITPVPSEFDIKLTYDLGELSSVIDSRFVRGQILEKDALIWETGVRHTEPTGLAGAEPVLGWLAGAHGIIHDWFFELIEGELLQQFKKERK